MNTTATQTTAGSKPDGPASNASILDADAAQLQALGYTSKFDRSMSQLRSEERRVGKEC